MEIGLQSGAETQGTNGNNEEGKEGPVEVKIVTNNIGQQDNEIKDKGTTGITKEQRAKKASSQDVNQMATSTRSSCRHH